MKLLLTLFLVGTLIGCASSQSVGKLFLTSERDEILKEPVPKGKSFLYVAQKSTSRCALFINKVYVGYLKKGFMRRIEVNPGEQKVLCYFGGYPTKTWFNKHYKGFKKITFLAKADTAHSVFYTWSYSKTHRMNRPYLVVNTDETKVNTFTKARYLLHPRKSVVSLNHIGEGEKNQWARVKNTTSTGQLSNFIQAFPNSKFKKEAQAKLNKLEKERKKDFKNAKRINTFDSYYNYIIAYPNAENMDDAAKRAVRANKRIKSKSKRTQNYIKLNSHGSKLASYIPKSVLMDIELMSIGPSNFNVGKIISLKKKGISTSILSAKVMATNERYKNFEIEEIMYLKKLGLNDKIIESMINVTAKYDSQMKMLQQNKEVMAQIQKLIKQSQKNVSTSRTYSKRSRSKSKAKGGDITSCLKRKAALEACRKLGGFLKSACKMTAKSNFPCNTKF